MKRLAVRLLAVASVLSLASCIPRELVWTRTHDFSGGVWKNGEEVRFSPDTMSLESAEARRAIVTLRYAADASPESFRVACYIWQPFGRSESDTITFRLLPLRERNGRNSNVGVFEISDTLLLKAAPKPGWEIKLKPLGLQPEPNGILSLTITLEK